MINMKGGLVDRQFRSYAVAGAVVAAVPLLLNLRDAAALIVGHFHLEMAAAFLLVSLALENSVWLMWVFPWAIPLVATVDWLVLAFGVAYTAAW